MSLLWQAKTAAVLKLQCSATVPRGCVFVSAYIAVYVCVCAETVEGNTGQKCRRREERSEGRDRQEELVIFAW